MSKKKGSKAAKAKLGKIIAAPNMAPAVAPKVPVKPMVGFKKGGMIPARVEERTEPKAERKAEAKTPALERAEHKYVKGGVVNRHGTERQPDIEPDTKASVAQEKAPDIAPAVSLPAPPPAAPAMALRAPMVKRKDDAMLAAPRRIA
jgi:hypothetical protein